MPDKSPAKTDAAMESDDLFGAEVPETPRVRRHSLHPPTPAPVRPVEEKPARDFSREPMAPSAPESVALKPKDEMNAEARLSEPEPVSGRPTFASTAQPSAAAKSVFHKNPAATSALTAPASGTLYYSTAPKPDKEKEKPMNTTSAAASSPTPSSANRPAAATTASTRPAATASTVATTRMASSPAASTSRAPSAVDYRANMERQAKEQKSMGGLLAILVYSLIGLFVIGAGLAGFGAYALSKQIRQQSLTIGELDKHYAEQNAVLTAQLKATTDTLTQAQADIGKQQQIIQQQQAALTKLTAGTEQLSSSLQAERQARAGETAALRTRLRSLENREPATH